MPFCHKLDSLVRGAAAFVDSSRWTTHKCYNLQFTVKMLTTCDGPAAIDANAAEYWSRLAIFAYSTCIRRPRHKASTRSIVIAFGTANLEWCGYPTVKNEEMYIRCDRIHKRDRRTDRHCTTQ